MTTGTLPQGSRTSLTTSAMNSLSNGNYVSCGTMTHTTNDPLEAFIEVKVTPGTVSGNKQAVVFVRGSLDGSNFESGPVSGSTTTDEPNLRYVGTIPLNTNSTAQTKIFSLASVYKGCLPYASEVVVKNDSGAAFAASGHHVYYAEVTANSA